jgi:nicotinate phosphoribosyltransferase
VRCWNLACAAPRTKAPIAGARAAIIGGAVASSNAGASHVLGIPPRGTHAHSVVQLMMAMGHGEIGAFRAYAELYPDDCLLLVDTVDTLQSGVPNAIRVFEELRRKGHKPVGIRLDSGDLAYLSIQAARMLNDAGFEETTIVLSSDLDELVIWQILTQIAHEAPRYGVDADQLIRRLVYGVGTRLITSWGEPALGGVYKLVNVRSGPPPAGTAPTAGRGTRRSSSPRRRRRSPTPAASGSGASTTGGRRPPPTWSRWKMRTRRPGASSSCTTPWTTPRSAASRPARWRGWSRCMWRCCAAANSSTTCPRWTPSVRRASQDVEALDPGIRRLVNPHIYHVSLSQKLWDLKEGLIAAARAENIPEAGA